MQLLGEVVIMSRRNRKAIPRSTLSPNRLQSRSDEEQQVSDPK